MEHRKQFTFYGSYLTAFRALSQREGYKLMNAVCVYGLEGTLPSLEGKTAAMFELIRPTLDAGRRLAENGALGGSTPKANRRQTAGETEKKKENDCKTEIETEIAYEDYGPAFTPEQRRRIADLACKSRR